MSFKNQEYFLKKKNIQTKKIFKLIKVDGALFEII